MAGIGVTELLIVLGIVLLIFGPKRLPMLGRQLGSGLREFKTSITSRADKDEDDASDAKTASTTDAEARAQAEAALGRPEGEVPVVDGEVVAERER